MPHALSQVGLVVLGALALAAAAENVRADGGDHRVSRAGMCSKSSSTRLELRRTSDGGDGKGRALNAIAHDDHRIEVTFTVRSRRSGVTWRVILLHERRIAYRGRRRTRPPGGTLILRYSLPDWYGSEVVTARASSPGGEICRASARL